MQRFLILLAGIVLLGFALPRSAAQPAFPLLTDSFVRSERLGIAHITSVDTPTDEQRYERALALGAGWNRWPLYWDRVETAFGIFDWRAYDSLVQSDLSYDLKLNVILLGIPAIHRSGDTINNLFMPVFIDGTDDPAPGKLVNPRNPWARFVHEAVQRYRPGGILAQENAWPASAGVRVWEIWNEPDYEFFWSGGVGNYARLLKVAYLIIHALDPEATVMFGGLLYPTQGNWLAQVLSVFQEEPNPEAHNWYMDAVAVHSYGDSWRSGWLTLVVRQTLVEYGLERPIWVTETGVPIWDDYPGPTWTAGDANARRLLATAEQQAAFLIQSAAYAWAEGAQVVFYHQLYDDCGNQPPGTDFAPGNHEACRPGEICAGDVFGLYRNPTDAICFSRHPQPNSARPVAEAFALLAHIFGSEAFSHRGVIDDVRADQAIAISFLRPQSDERLLVVWNTHQEPISIQLDALGAVAALVSLEGTEMLSARDGQYTLNLAPAEMPRQRFLSDRSPVDIGGTPVILIERVADADALAQLAFLTFESTVRPATRQTTGSIPSLTEEQAAALQAESPTGAIFYARDNARVRSAPSTEGTQVVGTLRLRQSAPIVGRLADNSWYQLDYQGQPVWVAAFLGEVYGSLDGVPVVAIAAPESENDQTSDGE
jgi:hypothetical protein